MRTLMPSCDVKLGAMMGAFLGYKLALLALFFWQSFLADAEVGDRAGRFLRMDQGPAGRNWSGIVVLVALGSGFGGKKIRSSLAYSLRHRPPS